MPSAGLSECPALPVPKPAAYGDPNDQRERGTTHIALFVIERLWILAYGALLIHHLDIIVPREDVDVLSDCRTIDVVLILLRRAVGLTSTLILCDPGSLVKIFATLPP